MSNPKQLIFPFQIDQKASFQELEAIEELIPNSWLSNAALGTPKECVGVINKQFDLGCDGVILHGVSPQELLPIVEEYKCHREPKRFSHLPNNPALPPSMCL